MDDQHAGRACETCRMRRVKCDKRLPGCFRCEKLGQPCSGYKTERRFFDDGAKVRRKFGDSVGGQSTGSPGQSRSPAGSPRPAPTPHIAAGPAPGSFFNTILGDTVGHAFPLSRPNLKSPPPLKREWSDDNYIRNSDSSPPLPSARPLTSLYPQRSNSQLSDVRPLRIPAIDPYANPPTAQLLGNYNAYDVDGATTPLPGPDEDFFDLDIDDYYAKGNNACGFIPGLPVIMSDINDIDPNETDTIVGDGESLIGSDSAIKARAARRRIGRAEADDRGQETAMLLRHFVEIMAPWMDILDIDGYFSRIMPLKATDNVMLRSALAAVAAKRIASIGAAPDKELLSEPMAAPRNISGQNQGDWFYKAASYYDKAISHLRIHLYRLSQPPPDDHDFANTEAGDFHSERDRRMSMASEITIRPAKRRRQPPSHTRDTELDDLLSAISVFSLYESLDNASIGFSQHLNGMQSLLEDKFRSRRMSGNILIHPSSKADKAATAAFWNFAREDLLSAYAGRQNTRLDTSDIALWNAAGLPICYEDYTSLNGTPLLDKLAEEGGLTGREEVFVAALVWVLMRIANFVNAETAPTSNASEIHGTPRSVTSPESTDSTSPHVLLWQNLRNLLDGWYDSLPITFDPYAELEYDAGAGDIHHGIKKLFYSLPLAAAALALYHLGQILLILHQPMEVTQNRTPASRIRVMRAMTEESQSHAREICGIALGGPHVAVQRQLAHPLHLAGLCFEEAKDRRLVIKLLRRIGTEANCLTHPLIQNLLTEWDWSREKP